VTDLLRINTVNRIFSFVYCNMNTIVELIIDDNFNNSVEK